MEADDLLCSRNARPRKALVGRAQWEINQPPSLKRQRASLEGSSVISLDGRSSTVALAKIIQAGRLTHADIAKGAGTSRTRVTAIANGNTHGVSTDVLIRVLAATGYRAEVRVKKAAA